MFERFTDGARGVVTGAETEARALRHPHIGTEHLLVSLLNGGDDVARTANRHGLDADRVRAGIAELTVDPLDPEALSTLGIDLDAVRAATERTFGEGALDAPRDRCRGRNGRPSFSPKAKKALELSLRHALRLKQKHIGSGHILLALLHDEEFMSARLAARAGVDVAALRASVEQLVTSRAA
jgi:ATP-dependent Clp protease ATP-binding subunit ClpA